MEIGKELLYLSKKDVMSISLSVNECIDILEKAHKAKAAGEIEMPTKPYIGDPLKDGFLSAYVAKINEPQQIGMKWLGGKSKNKIMGLPTFYAVIVINDPQTLCPIAIMDGGYITELRTACVSGMAMRHLANKDCDSLAILSCGFQGKMHLRVAMTTHPSIRRIYVWSPNSETVSGFISDMKKEFNLEYIAAKEPQEAVKYADIVFSATPLGPADKFACLNESCFRKGSTTISISRANHFYSKAFFSFDRYFVDDRETMELISHRSSFEQCQDLKCAEIGEYLSGFMPGRTCTDERVIFISDGIGINDVAVGSAIARRALEKGVGQILPL